jgi:hypothetical protein
MTMLVLFQALTFLQLIGRSDSYFVSDRSRALVQPFLNRQRQFQRDPRPGRETKVNLSLRNSAQDETETNGEAAASSASTRISLREQQPDRNEHDNNHRIPVPNSSTPPNTHCQYSDDDKIAGATLGDIMSDGLGLQMTSHSSSSTTNTSTDSTGTSSSSSSLAEQYGMTHPLDRMALTANGNLQRLVSSYYDAPVSVVVDSCILRVVTSNGAIKTGTTTAPMPTSTMPQTSIWDRTVHLTVFGGQTFCTAVSVITVHDALCQQLVQSGQVGLGQLFRYLDLLPEFTLRGAGVGDGAGAVENNTGKGVGGGGGFWRDYTLSCAELTCDIHEEFRPGLWDMQPPPNNENQNAPDSSASASAS